MGYALARVTGDPNCHIEKRPATNLKEVSKNLEDSESTFKRDTDGFCTTVLP